MIIGAIAGGGDKGEEDVETSPAATSPPVSEASPPAQTSPPATRPPATQPTATQPPATQVGPSYPNKQKEDHVAGANNQVQLSGYTTTVTGVARQPRDVLGRQLICGDVNIRNRDDRAQRYSLVDFRLQTPAGDVRDVTFGGPGNALGTGDLVPGGTISGQVSWDDPGQPGLYVVIWKPDAFQAARGIWLVNL